MNDTLTPAARSHRMSLIRSRDTKPEMALRRALHAQGLRYRIHVAKLAGKPDIVFGPSKVIVFVNGCFWHGHRCPDGHTPKSNSTFWNQKIQTNRSRDARNIRTLRREGWKVIVVWECKLRKKASQSNEANRVAAIVQFRASEKTTPSHHHRASQTQA